MAEALTEAIPDALERRVERVLKAACERKLSLATAESCTGGLLASLLTDVEGCSHAYERGFVTYTEHAKREMLDVPAEVLARDGAVSAPCARAMAEGALAGSKADLALAVTGFAGVGGPGDEAGLVHFALADRTRPTLHRCERFGDVGRGRVRLAALEAAVDMLARRLDADATRAQG